MPTRSTKDVCTGRRDRVLLTAVTFTWAMRCWLLPLTGGRASPCADELSRFEL